MTILRRIILVAAIFIFAATSSAAFTIPAPPTSLVNDYADMISPAARAELEAVLKAHEEKTSNQVVIATFQTLDDESLEDISISIAEKWKVGQKDKNNGVIILAFKDEREVRFEVGYGLEANLTDALSNTIIINDILPRFKAGDYDGGFKNAVNSVIAAIDGTYTPTPRTDDSPFGEGVSGTYVLMIFLGVFAAMGLFIFLAVKYGKSGSSGYDDSSWGSGHSGRSGSSSSSYSSSSGSSSSGGFSSGGGSFGGGGASGRW